MKSKNFIKNIFFLFLTLSLGFQFSCKDSESNVKLFAAAGTMLPVNEVCESFSLNSTTQIEKNYAASGALARQIGTGANADIYISANKQWIDHLENNNLLIQNSIKKIAENKLVVICSKDKHPNIEFTRDFDIQSAIDDKISIGDPKYVPVGTYAKQVLDSLNWYNKIESQIVLAKDVTSVLHYVELGECDWGIVYYSEAIKSDKIKITYEIPQQLHNPIVFYIALLNNNKESKEFYDFFFSKSAIELFGKYGFIVNNE
ncbi:molybdate ABC transporter substrate-binding protein [Bacteroidota bacterium]